MTIDDQINIKSGLISGAAIDEVSFVKLTEHKDVRGSFTEVFQQKWSTVLDPVQWSVVKSDANVMRGMHLHLRHDEYFCLIDGHCLVGLRDMRKNSPTFGQSALYELHSDDMGALIFPKGLLHGWYFFVPSVHIQAVSEAYHDYGHDDNWRCRWNDPALELPWPFDNPMLTEQAAIAPSLAELEAALKAKQIL
jgi:dTDP-4-dehydrorhamnose 3,5-epimerase